VSQPDPNGNLTGDGVWFYNYDTENMLLNASRPGVSASYIYDPLGRRSAKSVNTVLTTFLNDGVEEIADYNSTGTLLRRYVHGPGVDEYLVMYTGTGTANKSYYHANHQGSIVAMSDAASNVTEQHSYDSYGNSNDLTGNPFRYTGRRLDAETGLYYYRARYYSPSIGRFLQTDPIGYGDGLNWYAYVGNDPVNFTDPSGTIGRGDGWSDRDWKKFDKIQKKAAKKARNKAASKRKKANKLRDKKNPSKKDIAKADNLESEAGVIDDVAGILEDDGSGGYTADSLTSAEWSEKGLGVDSLAAAEVNGKKTYINQGHDFYLDKGLEFRWGITHEPLHNLGYRDQRYNGVRAYKFGNRNQRKAYKQMPNSQRLKNPDHIVDLIY